MLRLPNRPQTLKEIMIVGFSLWKKGVKTVLVPVGITSFFGIILLYIFGLLLLGSMGGYFSILSMPGFSESPGFLGLVFTFIASFVSLGTILGVIIFAIPLALMIYGMHQTFTHPSASPKKIQFFDTSSLSISDFIGYPISYKKLLLFAVVCFLCDMIIFIGFIFFIVPGFIALFALFFAPYLFITGEYSVWSSMKASASLFSKDRWLVVKRLSIFILVSLLFSSFLLTTVSTPNFDSIIKWAIILLLSSLFHACALSLLHDIQLRKMQ